MKKYIIFTFMIMFCSLFNALAQLCDFDKTFKTKPNGAVNTQFLDGRYTNTNGKFLDWFLQDFNVNSAGYGVPTTIPSPFYQGDNKITDHFLTNKDNKSEDGWELLYRKFGYQTDGTLGSNDNNPFFVLYNRYTGLVRVFVAIAELYGGYNYAEISMQFIGTGLSDSYETSMIDIGAKTGQPLRALDNFISKPILTSISEFVEKKKKWFYADFPMIYDPCTCRTISQILIQVHLISDALIQLNGETHGDIVSIQNKNGSVNTSGSSIALNLDNAASAAQKASNTYKDLSAFVNSGLAGLDDHYRYGPDISVGMQEQIEKNKEKARVGLGQLSQIITGVADDYDMAHSLAKFAKFVPGIGAAFSIFEFFTAGGQQPPAPQKVEVMPMSITTKSVFKGSITNVIPYQDIIFWNPGSDFTNPSKNGNYLNPSYIDPKYPLYNRTLGTFNLFKTPQVASQDFSGGGTDYDDEYTQQSGTIWRTMDYQYSLGEDIQYLVNPMAGLKYQGNGDVEIAGSLIFEFDDAPVNLFSEGVRIETPSIWATPYIPIGCLKDYPIRFSGGYSYRFRRLSDGSYQYYNLPSSYPNFRGYSAPVRAYLKLIVNLKRNDANDHTNNVVFLGKYPVKFFVGSVPTSSPLSEIPYEMTLSNTSISGNINAWGTITIGPDVTFNPPSGTKITVTAGEEIVIQPGVQIPFEKVTLQIGIPLECNNYIYPVNQQTVENYCSDNKYKGPRILPPNEPPPIETDGESWGSSDIITELFDAVPNPFSAEAIIRYQIGGNIPVRLTISDILGREIATLVNEASHKKGEFQARFDASSVQSGVYFSTLRAGNFTETRRLIIVK